jgi:hypothetical protein
MKIAEELIQHIAQNNLEELCIAEIHAHWSLTFSIKAKRNKSHFSISATKPFTGANFVNCKLSKDRFISFLTPYTNFKIKGESSGNSDVLMSDPKALSLLMNKKSSLELKDRTLYFSCVLLPKKVEKLPQIIDEFQGLVEKFQKGDVLQAR